MTKQPLLNVILTFADGSHQQAMAINLNEAIKFVTLHEKVTSIHIIACYNQSTAEGLNDEQ